MFGKGETMKKRGTMSAAGSGQPDEQPAVIESEAEAEPTPRTPDQLHRWLRDVAGVELSRIPVLAGSRAPFEYLVWSFFEGRGNFENTANRKIVEPRDCIVWANRGGGKTFLGALATLLDMIFKPGIEVRILGGSLEQSKRMYTHLRRFLSRPRLAGLVDGKLSAHRVRLRNGSELELMSQSQESVRGTRVQKLRCDEVELFSAEVWEAAQLTTRSRQIEIPGVGSVWVRGSVECLSTMHRPHGLMFRLVNDAQGRRDVFRWGVVDALAECGDEHTCRHNPDGGAAVIPLPIADEVLEPRPGDCPLLPECRGRAKLRPADACGHLGVDDAIGMKRRVSAATWETEMLCMRPRRTEMVLPEFDALRHVVPELPWEHGPLAEEQLPLWVCGMDFGFRGLTVILLAAIDAQSRVWVVRERAVAETLLREHIVAIRAGLLTPEEVDAGMSVGPGWQGLPSWIGIDPAGRGRNDQTGKGDADVLRQAGLEVRAGSLPQRVGLEQIRARLAPADGPTTLYIHERCTTLIESLERYHYNPDRPESDVPVKDGSDHAVDALRYLLQNIDRRQWATCTSYL